MAKSSKRLFSTFRMFANGALSLVAVLMFAVPSYAEIVEFFTDFTAGCKPATTYQQKDAAASLAPYFPNFSFVDQGAGSNLRYLSNDSDGYIKLAAASGEKTSFELTASSFLSSATCFDLTADDLVYEAYYACNWYGAAIGDFHEGISINNNKMTLIYHPGYNNGAFRIEGSYGSCRNQNIGFVPPVRTDDKPPVNPDNYTKMKLTIHRDEAAGNYVFTTEFGLATSEGYPYSYTHTCPIATIDADGGIKSIGPYAYNNNNNCVTNLRLLAPFADDAVNGAKSTVELRDMFIASDTPIHWYKFDDSSTTTVKDYGSSPKDGTATNVNMSTISELNQVASFSGSGSKVTAVLDSPAITGPWTAEFFLNAAQNDGVQSLLANSATSLRLSQYRHAGIPGFTQYGGGGGDYIFSNPDGGDFDYEIPTNEWIHVAFVNDTESMLLYIDGELVGKSTEKLISMPASSTSYIGVGGNGSSDPFKGMIDYVALYNRALSADEIYDHAHPIPEPATWALLILGAAGMLYWRKKN